jgi:hypothetical protein
VILEAINPKDCKKCRKYCGEADSWLKKIKKQIIAGFKNSAGPFQDPCFVILHADSPIHAKE